MVSVEKKQPSRVYIVHLTIALVCFLISISMVYGYFYLKNRYVKDTFKHYTVTLETIKHNLKNYLNTQKQSIATLSTSSEIIAFLKNPTNQSTIADFLKKNNVTANVIVSAPNFQPIFASHGTLGHYTHNERLKASMQRSLLLSDPDISDIFDSNDVNAKHTLQLFITMPVLYEKKILGFITLEINTQKIMNTVGTYQKTVDHEEIYIAKKINDSIGTLSSEKTNATNEFTVIDAQKDPYHKEFTQSVHGENGTKIAYDKNNQKMMVCWQYIPETQWGILIASSYTEIMQSLFTLNIIVLLILLCMGLLIGYLLKKSWKYLVRTLDRTMIQINLSRSCLYLLFIINTMLMIQCIARYHSAMEVTQKKQALQYNHDITQATQPKDSAQSTHANSQQDNAVYDYDLYLFLIGITIVLANIFIVLYSFIVYESGRHNVSKMLIYCCLIVALLTCIKIFI